MKENAFYKSYIIGIIIGIMLSLILLMIYVIIDEGEEEQRLKNEHKDIYNDGIIIKKEVLKNSKKIDYIYKSFLDFDLNCIE